MPVLFLVIRIQSVCRKAILICLIPIVAGVSNCGRCYHVYGGIRIFEGSAPQNEVFLCRCAVVPAHEAYI